MTTLALAAGAVLQVADATELADQVRRLLTDRPARAALRAGAEQLLGTNRGAAKRSAEVILEMLGDQALGVGPWALGGSDGSDRSTLNAQGPRPNTQGLIPKA
jgi:hypothetical protein